MYIKPKLLILALASSTTWAATSDTADITITQDANNSVAVNGGAIDLNKSDGENTLVFTVNSNNTNGSCIAMNMQQGFLTTAGYVNTSYANTPEGYKLKIKLTCNDTHSGSASTLSDTAGTVITPEYAAWEPSDSTPSDMYSIATTSVVYNDTVSCKIEPQDANDVPRLVNAALSDILTISITSGACS